MLKGELNKNVFPCVFPTVKKKKVSVRRERLVVDAIFAFASTSLPSSGLLEN
jgi:hypothetical protein